MCCNECTNVRSEILNLRNRRAIEIYPDLTIGNINGICGGSRRRATAVNAYLANQLYSSPLYTDPNFVPPPDFVWPTGSGRRGGKVSSGMVSGISKGLWSLAKMSAKQGINDLKNIGTKLYQDALPTLGQLGAMYIRGYGKKGRRGCNN